VWASTIVGAVGRVSGGQGGIGNLLIFAVIVRGANAAARAQRQSAFEVGGAIRRA